MSSENHQQTPLELTRGMIIAIAVILGIGLLSQHEDDRAFQSGASDGFAFGSWTAPNIAAINQGPFDCPELGISIDDLDRFTFYRLNRPDERNDPPVISFINRSQLLVGRIEIFDSRTDSWPPDPDQFGHPPADQAPTVEAANENTDDVLPVAMQSPGRPQIQVQTIRYPDSTFVWASLRKSPAWPLRVHIAQCQVGERTLRVSCYELNAKSHEIDYLQGPMSQIANALHPL